MRFNATLNFCLVCSFLVAPLTAEAQAPNFTRAQITPKEATPTQTRLNKLKQVRPKLGKVILKKKRTPKKARRVTLKSLNRALKKSGARGKGQKSYKDSDLVSVPSGPSAGKARGKARKISVKQYRAELNKLAKRFAAAGFDTTKPGNVETGRVDMDVKSLKASVAVAKAFKSVKARKVPRKMKLQRRAKARGTKTRGWGRLLAPAKYTVAKPTTSGSRGKVKKVKGFDSDASPKTKMYKSWGLGSKKTARVELIGHARIIASAKRIQMKAEATANGYLFGQKKTILGVSAAFDADDRSSKGLIKARATITVFGKDVVEETWERENYYKQTFDFLELSSEFGYAVHMAIGPIPVSIEVGAAFESGLEVSFVISPTLIESHVRPYVRADAYARFAIDIVVAAAGIEGRFTLIEADLDIGGNIGLDQDAKGLYIHYGYGADLGLKALSGKIRAFVRVNWCIVGCSQTFWLNIFDWTGLQKNWNLFGKTYKQYLTGTSKKAGKKTVPTHFCGVKGMKKIGKTACRVGGKYPPLKKLPTAKREFDYAYCYLDKKKNSKWIAVYCPKSIDPKAGAPIKSKVTQCRSAASLKNVKKYFPATKTVKLPGGTVKFCPVVVTSIGTKIASGLKGKKKTEAQKALKTRLKHVCRRGAFWGKGNTLGKSKKLIWRQDRKACPYWYDNKNMGIFTDADVSTELVPK